MPKRYWWKDAKIYELYVDRFAGNFQNLTTQLDYLERLGVNALHILPHYPSPMVDGGYDVMDYLNVRPELGTLADFDAFVAEAKRRNMRVITDFVLNHVSEHHPWFIEARTSKDSNRRNYFLWSETGMELSSGWNAPSGFKDSNWIYNEATKDYYYATFYPQQPDLNWDNPEVVDAMLKNMDFWAGRGVDGFRLDAALTLIKRDGVGSLGLPETHEVIKRIRKHLDAKYNGNVLLLAESHMEVEQIKAFFGDGDECQMAYHFPLMEAMFQSLMERSARAVEAMIERSVGIPENCAWAVFLRNHDEISLATLSTEDRAALTAFLDPEGMYAFNGGTVAARLAQIFKDTPERMRETFELLYSMPGSPIMYYGDEIGMRNLPIQEGVIDSRVYVRGDFDWEEAARQQQDPDSILSYTHSVIHKALWPYGKKDFSSPPPA